MNFNFFLKGMLLLVCGMMLANTKVAAEHRAEIPPELIPAVKNALPDWLEKLPPEHLDQYGFKSRDEFENVKLGEPIITYAPNLASRSISIEKFERALLSGSVRWWVPLEIQDRFACLLAARFSEENSVIVEGIGFRAFGERIQNARSFLASNIGKNARIEAVVLVHEPDTDFVLSRDAAGENLWLNVRGREKDQIQIMTPAEIRQYIIEKRSRFKK